MKIKNIIIVGGGTAGWIAANSIINRTPPHIKVKVIATPEIPIIGVGESTTGLMNDLIKHGGRHTGLNEIDFLKETESTFKIGIKHSDWHTVGEYFNSPIGDNWENDIGYPSGSYDWMRIYHVANKIKYNTLQCRLMDQNKLHYFKDNIYQNIYEQKQIKEVPVAYHLDTYKVGQYLKKQALTSNRCEHIDDSVVDFNLDEKGYIDYVITKGGQNINGDFFIDCTGFHKVLISKLENNKFISWADKLLVNEALNFNVPNEPDQPIRCYTHAWAQKNGWLWEIPTQKRMGCGYVFSNNHTTADKALEEIETVLNKKIEVRKVIKFEAGRMEKFWIKNCLSTGLSSAFVEPLEATSIHATLMQLNHFFEHYFKEDLPQTNLFENAYNSEMTEMWDFFRDFIVMHYITPRNDTQFWIDASDENRKSDRLKTLLEKWKYRMPRVIDYISDINNNFYSIGNVLTYQILMGMNLLDPKVAQQELKSFLLYDVADMRYKEMQAILDQMLPKMIDGRDYFNQINSINTNTK